jgi:hypothetical protein
MDTLLMTMQALLSCVEVAPDVVHVATELLQQQRAVGALPPPRLMLAARLPPDPPDSKRVRLSLTPRAPGQATQHLPACAWGVA